MSEKSLSTFEIITVEEAADILHISKSKLYSILKSDPSFPAIKLNRKWLVYKAKMPEWFAGKLSMK